MPDYQHDIVTCVCGKWIYAVTALVVHFPHWSTASVKVLTKDTLRQLNVTAVG